ncbi:MAG: hypothetical protein ACK5X3_16360, partial [Pseudomonadota bacterium]
CTGTELQPLRRADTSPFLGDLSGPNHWRFQPAEIKGLGGFSAEAKNGERNTPGDRDDVPAN